MTERLQTNTKEDIYYTIRLKAVYQGHDRELLLRLFQYDMTRESALRKIDPVKIVVICLTVDPSEKTEEQRLEVVKKFAGGLLEKLNSQDDGLKLFQSELLEVRLSTPKEMKKAKEQPMQTLKGGSDE